jgi:DNA polymerase-3 subunit gamma/tau
VNRPILDEELQIAWNRYAELRKDQVAEYHLINRGFKRHGNELIIFITNPVEEPLLSSIKTNLVTYLREQIGNSTIQVVGVLNEIQTARFAYTNKEKFESLMAKNPLLKDLRDRFGLDPDF